MRSETHFAQPALQKHFCKCAVWCGAVDDDFELSVADFGAMVG